MSIVWHLNFNHAVRCCNPIEFLHHFAETVERSSHVLKYVLHKNIVELVVLKWPGKRLDIEPYIGLAFGKIIRVDEAFSLVEPAAEVELRHFESL